MLVEPRMVQLGLKAAFPIELDTLGIVIFVVSALQYLFGLRYLANFMTFSGPLAG